MDDFLLVLRGMWFRRGTCVAVLVVASLVVGGAVIGPLYLRSAGESVLRDTLSQAPPVGRIIDDTLQTDLSSHPLARVRKVSTARLAGLPTLDRLLGSPVASLQLNASAGAPGASPTVAPLAYRQGVCGHVRMVHGRCARRPGAVMVSRSAAAAKHWRVGQPLAINGRRVSVSGIYAPVQATGDYWGVGHSYFAALSNTFNISQQGSSLDAIFAPLATVRAQPGYSSAIGAVDLPFRVSRVRLTDLPALKKQLLAYDRNGDHGLTSAVGDETNSSIRTELVNASSINDKLTSPLIVVEVQLLVLCWLILFLVVANAAEARGPEVALAKLRGAPASATVAFGLADTLALVAAAVPIGFGLAWGWVTALAAWVFAPGTPVVLTPTAGIAAVAAGAGAAVAAGLAGSRTLRRPIVEQWRRASRRARARSWIVDAIIGAAAVAGLVVLARNGVVTSGASSVLALIAPGLMVLAAALLGSRLLPGLCRAGFDATRRRRRIARFLAVRQLGRRPSTLRLALVLALAFGLVTFGVDAWAVARGNAHDRAWTEVGAAKVIDVAPPPGKNLAAIVAGLDPTGRKAAAVSMATDFSRQAPVQLLAVQPQRFARVAFWRSDFGAASLATLASRLTRRVAPAVQVAGDALELDVRASQPVSDGRPVLVADIAQQNAGRAPVVLGRVHAGNQTLRAALPGCATQSCHLAGLHLERSGSNTDPISGQLAVTGVRVHTAAGWRPVAADLSRPGGWRPAGKGAASSTAHGLLLTARASAAENPSWRVADYPPTLPALTTRPAQRVAGGQIAGLGGENDLKLRAVAAGPALPGAGALGVVVDRAYAQRAAYGSSAVSTESVWLAPSAAAAFPKRLKQAGVAIIGSRSAAEQTAQYDRQGPALAILLFLAGAALGALLAAGGTVLNLHLAGRRRTYELAAISALGVRRRVLLAALYAEQGLLLIFGVGVGVAAGIGGALLALPAVPEFADHPSAPPLLYGLHAGPVFGTVVAAVVVMAVAIGASSANLLRTSRFSQLREAPA